MYRTAVLERARGTIPLRLTRVVRREFAGGTTPADTPWLHRYYADMAALYGVGHRPEILAGNTFGMLAGAVLADVVSPVDLVIIAHVLPDLDPRFSPGARLAGTVPGAPLVFAMSGTDGSIAFTALRVAGAYARRHSYRRVVVLVVDQATLPYRTDAEPAGDAAVALLLEDGPGAEITVGRSPEVAGDRVIRMDEAGGFPATGVWAGLDLGGHTVLVHHPHYCAIRGS